jgi:hypothetical protein
MAKESLGCCTATGVPSMTAASSFIELKWPAGPSGEPSWAL